jgi:hypothetical protein
MVPMRSKKLIACLVLGCASASPLHAAAKTPAPVAIALAQRDAQWEVRYALAKPASALRFEREDRKGTRASTWQPVDPALTVSVVDGEEVVRRGDGKPFREAAFRMAPLYLQMDKDYAPFSPFGDGGLLIYTGRFHACAEKCTGEESFHTTLQPPAGAHAIFNGQVDDAVDFEDRNDGTNVYVGRAEPVATPDVVAVIDPTLPQDVRTRLDSLLPRLMAFYGKEFGVLQTRPMLFASNDANHPGGGYGYQGGTLPGQVFVHRYGQNAAFGTPEFLARQDWFFAHEAAHLYQHYPALADEGDSWIHEGGADALAAVALQSLGVIGPEAVKSRLESSVETCATGLGKSPLRQSHVDGNFDSFYSCGFVMQMAVDAAARRASAGQCGLACVWRDFQARVGAGAPWSTDTFLAVAAKRTDDDTAKFLRAVAGEKPAQAAELLRGGLAQAGWTLGDAPATGK